MSGRADWPMPCGPYETEQQARADVAYIHEQSRRSVRRGVLTEPNRAQLMEARQGAGVTPGVFNAKILTWLANCKPETCAVITGLIARANAAGLAPARPVGAGTECWRPQHR